VFADTEYRLSAFIKTELESGTIHLEVQDTRGWQVFTAVSNPLGGKTDWTKVNLSFRTTLATEAIVIGLRHVGRAKDGEPVKGQVWLDDVSLSAVDTGRPQLSKEELEKAIKESRLITLENRLVKIAFSEPRLRIRSIEFKKRPDLNLSPGIFPEVPLYQLKMTGPKGESEEIRSLDARSVKVERIGGRRGNSYRLEAHHTGHLSKVWGYVTLDESGFVDMRLELGGISEGWFVSEILFPQMATVGLLSDDAKDRLWCINRQPNGVKRVIGEYEQENSQNPPTLQKGPLHLVLDSSGLKVYGEGEGKVRQHGWCQRRTGRKIHLSVEAPAGEVQAVMTSEAGWQEAQAAPLLLKDVDQPIASVAADGADDRRWVYRAIQSHSPTARGAIPPRRDARLWQHGKARAAPLPGDEWDDSLGHARQLSGCLIS
jgi:hypothetical protein